VNNWRQAWEGKPPHNSKIGEKPVVSFCFESGGQERRRRHNVEVVWADVDRIIRLLAKAGDEDAKAALARPWNLAERLASADATIERQNAELERLRAQIEQIREVVEVVDHPDSGQNCLTEEAKMD